MRQPRKPDPGEEQGIEDVIAVVNPAAGGGSAARRWPAVAARLRSEGCSFDEAMTRGPGDAEAIARRATQEGRTTVLAAGGDGTVNEVVNGILGAGSAELPDVAVIPLGTGTDLCRTFGIPLDAARAAGLVRSGARRRIDVGRLTCAGRQGPNSRYFVNIADTGIGGEVADFVNGGFKFVNGELTFSLAAVITLLRFRNPVLSLDLDGTTREVTAQQVVIANCQYYGGGMRMAPQAVPDDGLFDVIINGDLGAFETIGLLGRVRSGKHMSHPKMERVLARRVEVSSRSRVGVDADGERPGDLPATFEVVPRAIQLLVPAT